MTFHSRRPDQRHSESPTNVTGLDPALVGAARLLEAVIRTAFQLATTPRLLWTNSNVLKKLRIQKRFWERDAYWLSMYEDIFGYNSNIVRRSLVRAYKDAIEREWVMIPKAPKKRSKRLSRA